MTPGYGIQETEFVWPEFSWWIGLSFEEWREEEVWILSTYLVDLTDDERDELGI